LLTFSDQVPHELQTRLDACDIDLALVIDRSCFQAQRSIKPGHSQLLHKAWKIDPALTWV